MPSGADMLAEWLAEGSRIDDRSVEEIARWPLVGWRCKLYDGVNKFKGTGPTPDAAIRAAVEKANKERI